MRASRLMFWIFFPADISTLGRIENYSESLRASEKVSKHVLLFSHSDGEKHTGF